MRIFPPIVWALLSLAVLPAASRGATPYEDLLQQLITQPYQQWRKAAVSEAAMPMRTSARVQIRGSGSTKAIWNARQKALADYLSELIPAMKLPASIAHIPREHPVSVDAQQRWTKYYALARNQLRPQVEYSWSSNATGDSDVVTLSNEHVDVLRENFDFIAWYRRELENHASKQEEPGAEHFKLALDYIMGGILEGLPKAPTINPNDGSMTAAKWDFDERRLREQLVMTYRLLKAKYQVYPQYEEFAAADVALLSSLVKVALLMGSRLDPSLFDEMNVELRAENRASAWKQPFADAFLVVKQRAECGMLPDEASAETARQVPQPCIIKIPPPKPKQKPKKAPQKKPQKDDVKKLEIVVRSE